MSIQALRYTDNIAPEFSFLKPIEEGLRLVDDILSNELFVTMQNGIPGYWNVLEASGKGLRPSLTLLSALACNKYHNLNQVASVAACTEILHLAAVIHNDIRNYPNSIRASVKAGYLQSNQISVLSGDYMLAKAFLILTDAGGSAVMETLSLATTSMAEGEIRQIEICRDIHSSMDDYLAMIRLKTASLISACCRIGAIMADGTPEEADAVTKYGIDFGIAFQIMDDLINLTAGSKTAGNPVGSDLRKGRITMPLLLTIEKVCARDRARIESLIKGDDATSDDISFIRDAAVDSGAIEGTRHAVSLLVKQAVGHLSAISDSQAYNSLAELAENVPFRNS